MRKVVLALLAAFTTLAAPAFAAEGTLSASSPTHKWAGSNLFGFGAGVVPFGAARCSPVYQCDNEHVEVKDTGTLTVEIKAGARSNDLDVRLFKSDESGTAPGSPQTDPAAMSPMAADEQTNADAKIVVKNLKPGFYVIQVAVYNAQAGSFDGTATLAPAPPATAPAAPATPPAAAPQPQQTSPTPAQNKAAEAKRKKKLASCKKKAKKIKNKKKRAKAKKRCAKKHGKKRA